MPTVVEHATVAVITPTFNHEAYIGNCIRSVLGQSWPDWEMVVMDDGSTDRTVEIARSFGDPRIQVISSAHRGLLRLAETYGSGLAATSAALVAILEGDDEWPADKLARQIPAFADEQVVLAYGAAALIDERGCAYATYGRRPAGDAAKNRPVGSILPYLLRQNFVIAPTVIVRRTSLQLSGGFLQPAGVPFVDHPTWLRLALSGTFAYEPLVVGKWRRHAAQFTTALAVGPQPDSTPFLLDVSESAVNAGLLDRAAARSIIDGGPTRQALWSRLAGFRLVLLNGTIADAVNAARGVIRVRHPKSTALAGVGLIARMLGSDLEWLFRASGRMSWPSRRHRRGHQADHGPNEERGRSG